MQKITTPLCLFQHLDIAIDIIVRSQLAIPNFYSSRVILCEKNSKPMIQSSEQRICSNNYNQPSYNKQDSWNNGVEGEKFSKITALVAVYSGLKGNRDTYCRSI